MIGDSSESLGAKGDLAGGDTSDKMPERYHHCATLQYLEEGQNLISTKIQNSEQNQWGDVIRDIFTEGKIKKQ